jgi:hypothetical protein
MANPVTLDLVSAGPVVPAPDNLIAGPKGVVYTDIVKVRAVAGGELRRGMLLMSSEMEGEPVFVPCTLEGLSERTSSVSLSGNAETVDVSIPGAKLFGVLADTVTVEADERAETGVYFEGDFNENAVIFSWETEDDDHAEQVEIAREALRRRKIFLRGSNK